MLLIKNGNLITMAGMYEQTGDILIDDGKIVKVGQVGEVPEDCQIIDAAGRTVTPGLVDPHCHAGLWGTACREEMDGNEYTEPVLPGLRGLDAINPEDATFDAALRQGITTVVTGPGSSNIVGGTFLAIKTAGEDMESRVICPELAMKMALGENPKMTFGNRGKAPRTRMMSAALMREELFKAKEYYENYKLHGQEPDFPFDFHLHSLMRVFEGMRVKIHAHQADDIQTAVRVANEFGLHYSIEHCTEGWMIPEFLKKNNAECLLGPTVGGKSKIECQNRSYEAGRILEEDRESHPAVRRPSSRRRRPWPFTPLPFPFSPWPWEPSLKHRRPWALRSPSSSSEAWSSAPYFLMQNGFFPGLDRPEGSFCLITTSAASSTGPENQWNGPRL